MPDILERTVAGRKITRIGRGHYLCKSQSRPSISYSVDLAANNALGQCTCDDFKFRKFPRWKKIQANYSHLRCKHIREVRDHVLDQLIHFYKDDDDL